MAKVSKKRINAYYGNLYFTVNYLDKNGEMRFFEKNDRLINRASIRKFLEHITTYLVPECDKPFNVKASYTICLYDAFAPKSESNTNSENYINGYPVIHRIQRNVDFWFVYNENHIQKIQGYLRAHNLPDNKFLAVTRKDFNLYSFFPEKINTFPLELWDFFNKKHRSK